MLCRQMANTRQMLQSHLKIVWCKQDRSCSAPVILAEDLNPYKINKYMQSNAHWTKVFIHSTLFIQASLKYCIV